MVRYIMMMEHNGHDMILRLAHRGVLHRLCGLASLWCWAWWLPFGMALARTPQ